MFFSFSGIIHIELTTNMYKPRGDYMIKRDFYLEQIKNNMWNGEIKVITSIRRCGKSVLLFDLFYDYLIESGIEDSQIIKIELDQRKYYKFINPITLCEFIESEALYPICIQNG